MNFTLSRRSGSLEHFIFSEQKRRLSHNFASEKSGTLFWCLDALAISIPVSEGSGIIRTLNSLSSVT